MTSIEKRVHKPGSATYQIDVKSVDAYGNESAVVSQTNVRGVPPDPTVAPGVALTKGGRRKWTITITGTYAGTFTDDDIRNGIVKAVIAGKTTRPRVQIEDDGTFSHVFHGDKGDTYDFSFRVVDDDGKRSGFSPSATGTLGSKKPGKVTGKTVATKTRAVVVKYTAPTVWSDNVTAMDPEDIDHFKIVLKNNVGATVETDDLFKGLRKSFNFTKAEMDALNTPLHADVTAIGVDGEDDGVDGIASSATPTEIQIGELPGTITYAQSGTLGVSRYGSSAAMNAASAKEGDLWLNTSYSPVRIYRYLSGAWTALTLDTTMLVGTIIANSVVAGAIDGHTINGVNITGSVFTGGTFQTGTSGDRVVISSSSVDRILFYASSNSVSIRCHTSTGALLVSGGLDTAGPFNHRGTTFGVFNYIGAGQVTRANLGAGATLAEAVSKIDAIIGDIRGWGFYA